MIDEFNYAIETLEIEKYRMIGLLRQLRLNAHTAQTVFTEEEKRAKEQHKQLESAIVALRRVEKGWTS